MCLAAENLSKTGHKCGCAYKADRKVMLSELRTPHRQFSLWGAFMAIWKQVNLLWQAMKSNASFMYFGQQSRKISSSASSHIIA